MTTTRTPHYESEDFKKLREYLREHATGYCQREHTGVSESGYGYHLEIWTNKHDVYPVMLTAWEQPSGEWYCQLWNGAPIEFPKEEKENPCWELQARADALEKEIEGVDKDVDYLKNHGSQQEYDEARSKQLRLNQKLGDVYRQLNKE